jgi:hypothetical protein
MSEQPAGADRGDQESLEIARTIPQVGFLTVQLRPEHRTDLFEAPHPSAVQDFIRGKALRYAAAPLGEVWVAPYTDDPTRIAGFYTLSADSIRKGELGNRDQKQIPMGIPVPMMLVGFIGRDKGATKGGGTALLIDALKRAASKGGITHGLMLRAENDRLAEIYESFGFRRARSNPTGTPVSTDGVLMYASYASLFLKHRESIDATAPAK